MNKATLRKVKRRKPRQASVSSRRMDPTRTASLRRKTLATISARFDRLRADIIRLVVEEDAFGIAPKAYGIDAIFRQAVSNWIAVANCGGPGSGVPGPCPGGAVAQAIGREGATVEASTSPAVKEATQGAFKAAFSKIAGVALSEFPAWALDTADQWIFEEIMGAAGSRAGVPGAVTLVKAAAWGAAKAYLAVKKLSSRRRAGNVRNAPLSLREWAGKVQFVLAAVAEAAGQEAPPPDKIMALLRRNYESRLVHKTHRGRTASARPAPSSNPPDKEPLTANVRWRFISNPEKVKAFRDWLKQKIGEHLQGRDEESLWKQYIEEGYKQGAGRAFDDTRRPQRIAAELSGRQDYYRGTRDEFLRSSFGQPVAVEKVKLLAGRAFDELEGVTGRMATEMSRVLVDGLVQGDSPRDLGRELADRVDVGRSRAETIARTEIIRAHAEGQLDALENLGVEEVGVMVEWTVTLDDKLCDLCAPLAGAVLKLDEARGMIPRHPNCRCAWIPANVGEDTEDQTRGKAGVSGAIRQSQEEGGQGDDWGDDISISIGRPQPLI